MRIRRNRYPIRWMRCKNMIASQLQDERSLSFSMLRSKKNRHICLLLYHSSAISANPFSLIFNPIDEGRRSRHLIDGPDAPRKRSPVHLEIQKSLSPYDPIARFHEGVQGIFNILRFIGFQGVVMKTARHFTEKRQVRFLPLLQKQADILRRANV